MTFLLAAVFLPLLLSPLAYIFGRKLGTNFATWFSFSILAISTILLMIPAMSLKSGSNEGYQESYQWSQFGNFGLRLDGLSLPFALIIYILCTVLALYSKPYMIHKITETANEIFRVGPNGSNGARNKNDYVERNDYHTRRTTNSESQSESNENSHDRIIGSDSPQSQIATYTPKEIKQYVNTQVGLYFALYLAFSMGMLGTVLATNLIEFYVFFELMLVPSFFLIAFYGYGARRRIALMFFFWTHVGAVVLLLGLLAMGFFAGGFDFDTIRANAGNIPAQWLPLIVFALVIGLGVKLAAFMLHIWLPYAHAEAPTPVSALLSPAMIGIGAYGLLRLWMELLTGNYEQYSLYINMWGLATMIYGGAMALMQDDIKKVLAYSSISQMGYILFGLSSESILGITGGTMMYVTHGLGKAILFMMAGSIILQTAAAEMDPLRTTMFALGILTTVLSSAYILWMFKRIFFGKIPEQLAHVKDSNRYITATMAVFAAMTLIIGVYPDLFLNPITDYYTNNMFQGQEGVLPVPSQDTGTESGGVASENIEQQNSGVDETAGAEGH